MKLQELIAIEDETITMLRARAAGGDIDAARVLLEHLRAASKAISEWQSVQKFKEKKKAPPSEMED
jgi:hypothetical protein